MSYRDVIVYFMSGTGNSFRAAQWVVEVARRGGVAAHVRGIVARRERSEIGEGAGQLVGVVFPTHGFIAPWSVIRFALRLPSRRGPDAFVVAARGGLKFGPVYVPGLEGLAGYFIAMILALKGYRIRGVMGLDVPCSWLACHAGLKPPEAAAILARARSKVESFAEAILSGRTRFSGFFFLFLGVLLSPLMLAYVLAGRFFLAKLFFADNRCTGCGQCARSCPFGAIRMIGRGKLRPYWTFSCESCMRCMAYCPEQAVEAGHSWAILLYYLSSFSVVVLVTNGVLRHLPWGGLLSGDWSLLVLQYPAYFLSLWAAYWVFWWLVRIPPVNALFAYTTLTRVYRRYHEPETKLSDMLEAEARGHADTNRP